MEADQQFQLTLLSMTSLYMITCSRGEFTIKYHRNFW